MFDYRKLVPSRPLVSAANVPLASFVLALVCVVIRCVRPMVLSVLCIPGIALHLRAFWMPSEPPLTAWLYHSGTISFMTLVAALSPVDAQSPVIARVLLCFWLMSYLIAQYIMWTERQAVVVPPPATKPVHVNSVNDDDDEVITLEMTTTHVQETEPVAADPPSKMEFVSLVKKAHSMYVGWVFIFGVYIYWMTAVSTEVSTSDSVRFSFVTALAFVVHSLGQINQMHEIHMSALSIMTSML